MVVYIFIAAVLILLLLELFLVSRKKRQFGEKEKAFVLAEWQKIISHSEGGDKQAVIESDKLFDYVLRKKGYSGTLAEKLQKAEKLFTNCDEVWSAHKLRNKIVHEVGFEPSEKQMELILAAFANAFRDLGVNVK